MPEKEIEQSHATENDKTIPRIGVKRPLVVVVLALMLGLAGAAWGLQIPKVWLIAILVGLLAVILLFYLLSSSRGSTDQQVGRR